MIQNAFRAYILLSFAENYSAVVNKRALLYAPILPSYNVSKQQNELSCLSEATHNQDHGYTFDTHKINHYYRILT